MLTRDNSHDDTNPPAAKSDPDTSDLGRRAFSRAPFITEIEVVYGDSKWTAMSEDISQGGMGFVLEPGANLDFGAVIECRVELPALEQPVTISAWVRWTSAGPFGQRVGVQFRRGLRAREAWAVNGLLRR